MALSTLLVHHNDKSQLRTYKYAGSSASCRPLVVGEIYIAGETTRCSYSSSAGPAQRGLSILVTWAHARYTRKLESCYNSAGSTKLVYSASSPMTRQSCTDCPTQRLRILKEKKQLSCNFQPQCDRHTVILDPHSMRVLYSRAVCVDASFTVFSSLT